MCRVKGLPLWWWHHCAALDRLHVGMNSPTGALLSGYATPTGTGSTDYIIDCECITGSPTKTYVSGTGGVNIEGIVTTVACCGSECW